MTNTKFPVWLRCTATDGTVTASSVRTVKRGVDQNSRPQHFALVAHDPADSDHAGCRIDRILDHGDGGGGGGPVSDLPLPGMVATTDDCLLFIASCRSLQNPLGDRKGDVDRSHLVDGRQCRRIRRPHKVADLDRGRADASADRCLDLGVALLDPEIVQIGLIGLNGRDGGVGGGLGVVDVDLGGGALAD